MEDATSSINSRLKTEVTDRPRAGCPRFIATPSLSWSDTTSARGGGNHARSTMGSDNPKGVSAPLRVAQRYGRYAALVGVCLVLCVTLFTDPSIDPKSVQVTGTPQRAGAGEAATQSTLPVSMRNVANKVGVMKTKLRDAAAELGDVGLHETTMPRKKRPPSGVVQKVAKLGDARVLVRGEGGKGRVSETAGHVQVAKKTEQVVEKTLESSVSEDSSVSDASEETAAIEEASESEETETKSIEEAIESEETETETIEEASEEEESEEEKTDSEDPESEETGSKPTPKGLYTLGALTMGGEQKSLSYAAGKVTLVTNVASQ